MCHNSAKAAKLAKHASANNCSLFTFHCSAQAKIPMNQMTRSPLTATGDNSSSFASTLSPSIARTTDVEIQPLNDVFVSLESIRPGLWCCSIFVVVWFFQDFRFSDAGIWSKDYISVFAMFVWYAFSKLLIYLPEVYHFAVLFWA